MATEKQKKAIAKVVENGGNVSKAMRDAGYSVETAKTPAKLTQSQAFQYFLNEAGVTDQKLVSVIKDGLEAERVVIVGNGDQAMADVQPDHPTRHKFLETTLKIRGLTNNQDGGTTVNNFGSLTVEMKNKYED